MKQQSHLELDRCPHCYVCKPQLQFVSTLETMAHSKTNMRKWCNYSCTHCGGVVLTASHVKSDTVTEMYPKLQEVDEAVPQRAREYLQQAMESLHTAAGAVMLAASAIDAMLKEKGYREGDLYPRIEKAASDHLITAEMSAWAHEVRLDANDQRHADELAALPDEPFAKKVIEFATALAEFLFVLPSRVKRGRAVAKNSGT